MSSAIFPLSTDLRKLTQIWRMKGLSVMRYALCVMGWRIACFALSQPILFVKLV